MMPIVIDIDGSVDVISVPTELASLAGSLVPKADVPRIHQLLALLIARLGPDVAIPSIAEWIARSPAFLTHFPESIREQLESGSFDGLAA